MCLFVGLNQIFYLFGVVNSGQLINVYFDIQVTGKISQNFEWKGGNDLFT